MTNPTRIFEDERSVMARVRNVAIVGWRDAPTADHMRRWHTLGRTIAREHPGTGACIDIVVRGTPRFTEDVRRAAEDLARDARIFELGIAHALLIPGLAGTAVRTFIQTILLVSRPATPVKVAGDIHGATAWLAPRLAAHGWTEPELRAACGTILDALGTSAVDVGPR